jgi:hypothetical protein
MVSNSPKWATADRQAQLVKLFLVSRGFCVYGHRNCLLPEHHYEIHIESLIRDWQSDDKSQRAAEWRAEREAMHASSERHYPVSGQFDGIAKDIYFDQQPLYYRVGMGISGLTLTPFAKVKIPSSPMALHVDLGGTMRSMSKSQKRKAVRYGRGLPADVEARIELLCQQAVRHYLDSLA